MAIPPTNSSSWWSKDPSQFHICLSSARWSLAIGGFYGRIVTAVGGWGNKLSNIILIFASLDGIYPTLFDTQKSEYYEVKPPFSSQEKLA